MDSKIDFSSYSLNDLYQSGESIDREKYPEIAKEIDGLILQKKTDNLILQKEIDSNKEEDITKNIGDKATVSKSNKKLLKEPWLFLNTLFLSSLCISIGFIILSDGSTTIVGKRVITAVSDPFLFYFGVFSLFGMGIIFVGNYIKLKYNKHFKQD